MHADKAFTKAILKALGEFPSGASAAKVERKIAGAVDLFLLEIFGPHATPQEILDPASDALYADSLQLGYSVGLTRASDLTGLGMPALVADRNAEAVQRLILNGFDRLSEGGRIRLGDRVIEGTMETLKAGLERGASPLEMARDLSKEFDAYKEWEFQRLAHTEVAYAQVGGLMDEFHAEGLTDYPGAVFPLYHAGCGCGVTTNEHNQVIPDIPVTACELCQSFRVE